jgi:hypothetical protein
LPCIYRKNSVIIIISRVDDRPVHIDACDRGNDMGGAETPLCLFKQPLDKFNLAKIALDHQRAITASADLFDHVLSVAVFWQTSQNETGAFGVKALSDGTANSLRRTGYNCDFADQFLHFKSLATPESQHKPHAHATECGGSRKQGSALRKLPRRSASCPIPT